MPTKQNEQDQSNFPKMSAPALRALHNAGYTRLNQLAGVTEAELKKLHGMGPNALGKLQIALSEAGLSFSDGKK
ncbi:MAG: DNA-binding protein [Chloroflexia bacterium]